MDYKRSIAYLNSLTNYERVSTYNYNSAYTLGRIKKLLLLLYNPQESYPCAIIAGTKGKGSTASFLSSILKEAGIKTGTFISPHLISIRERILINSRQISEQEFAACLSRIKRTIEKNRLKGITFFEALTACAFLYFKNKEIDAAVLEVGLGGRLDATNAAIADIVGITPISYDHTHLLGNSLQKIAREKSAVIKKGAYVVCAPQQRKALRVIRKATQKKRADQVFVGKDITFSKAKLSLSETNFDAKTDNGSYKGLKIPLIGNHQIINALTALGMAEEFKKRLKFKISKNSIKRGLAKVKFEGRLQIFSQEPLIILDGAQNSSSALSLKNTVLKLFKKKISLILGISSDKDIEKIGKILCPMAERVIFTKAGSPRATDPRELARRLGVFSKEYYATYDVRSALLYAKALADKDSAILITGSLFLVGDILKIKK